MTKSITLTFLGLTTFSLFTYAADEQVIELEANTKLTMEFKANTRVKLTCSGTNYTLRADENGRYDVVDQDGYKILFGVSYEIAKKEVKELNEIASK